MKNIFRNWLGINEDVKAIAADMHMVPASGFQSW